jgi:hypothetical protein
MLTREWLAKDPSPKADKLFRTEGDVIWDIADRALGGFDDVIDDVERYPGMIFEYYVGKDCPEPLDQDVYQRVMHKSPEKVKEAIFRRITTQRY